MKKILCIAAAALLFGLTACASPDPGGTETGGLPAIDPEKRATILPTEYDVEEIVSADETEAGDFDSWWAQVFSASGGGSNDEATPNSLIKSPFHTLTVNGTSVPVYTARCGKSAHSYAWVDVADKQDDFQLEVTLTMHRAYKQCVILPISAKVPFEAEENVVRSMISAFGSYSYTFSKKETGATDPEQAPLTLMVCPVEEFSLPDGYDLQEIAAGRHADDELEFSAENTAYVFKKGYHEIAGINIPSNSIVYLERGAYLKCDRAGRHPIHSVNTENARLLGRGLLDMGALGPGEHVIYFDHCTENVTDGLTVINSNSWTVTYYNCDQALMEHILLLGYRTYSDGLMMSECTNSTGRYNFVRTGDDGIEFKGTAWHGTGKGENCLYEHNDVWTDKGIAYGVIYENVCPMENMTFRDNHVGFALPTWIDRCAALDCYNGTVTETVWKDILFENIEIYHVVSPQVIINQMRNDGGTMQGLTFENITVHSAETGVYAYAMSIEGWGTIEDVTIRNYTFCGKKLTAEDMADRSVFRFSGDADRTQLTLS